MVSRCSLSTPQASGLDSRTQESVGRKITKAIFHARGVGHQGKSEPLCMICQTAEASKCLGRGLRCEPGTARWPPGAGVNVRLLSAAEASLGHPPHTARPDELVTRPWLDCPAPGRKPGCPEMSSGSPVPLSARGVVWGLRISLIRPSRPTLTAGPPVAPGAGQPLGHRAHVPAPGQAPTAHLAPPPAPRPCQQICTRRVANVPILLRKQLRLRDGATAGRRPLGGRAWTQSPTHPGTGPSAPRPPDVLRDATHKHCCVFRTHGEAGVRRAPCFPLDPPDDPKRQALAEPLGAGPDIRMCSEALSSLCRLFSLGFPSTRQ